MTGLHKNTLFDVTTIAIYITHFLICNKNMWNYGHFLGVYIHIAVHGFRFKDIFANLQSAI